MRPLGSPRAESPTRPSPLRASVRHPRLASKVLARDGQNFDLLHTLDLSALFIKGEGTKENVVAIKLYNQKGDQGTLISGHEFHIVQQKI